MTTKKIIALILVVLLLGAGVYYLRSVERADKVNMRGLYSEVEPLQRQRETLAAERNGLESYYTLQMRDVGTIQLLIQELDDQVFTEIYPQMRDRGFVGVLGISTKQMPGAEDKLTVDQYNRLLKDGWGSCLIFEKGDSFVFWYSRVSNLMKSKNLAVPTAVFFPEGTYEPEMNDLMIERGIRTVILQAEDGRSSTVTPVDGELWFTGAMPWNYTGVATDTELLARTNGANLSFTMSLNNLWDAYEEESFIRILDSWVDMLDADDPLAQFAKPAQNSADLAGSTQAELLKPLLKVTNYETAREAHLAARDNNEMLQKEFEERQAQLDQEIAALDEQIRQTYDRWEQSSKIGKG